MMGAETLVFVLLGVVFTQVLSQVQHEMAQRLRSGGVEKEAFEIKYAYESVKSVVYAHQVGAACCDAITRGSETVAKAQKIGLFGAMIMSEAGGKSLQFTVAGGGAVQHGHHGGNKTKPHVNVAAVNAAKRTKHAKALQQLFPFPTAEWPGVFTKPCPQMQHRSQKTERGVAFAHAQIWADFIYFDRQVVKAALQGDKDSPFYKLYGKEQFSDGTATDVGEDGNTKTKAFNTNKVFEGAEGYWLSWDGNYEVHKIPQTQAQKQTQTLKKEYDGTEVSLQMFQQNHLRYFKHGVPFLADDVISIFEDDAEYAAIYNATTTIREELAQMGGKDIVFLGWCEGRKARPVPMCAHAYSLTRRGAFKLDRYYVPCGEAVDEQMVILCKEGILTYRRALPWSYKELNSDLGYPVQADHTFGIFHQKKMGSFNGHA